METIGSLIDKMAVARLRLEAMTETHARAVPLTLVENQLNDLKKETNHFLTSAIQGKVLLEEPKYKFYNGETVDRDVCVNFAHCIEKLFEANYQIWHLEDSRRDEMISCEKLKMINKKSNLYNKLRNNMIDEINRILSFEIHKLK